MRLTKTQQALYDAMKAGVAIHYMPYMGRFNPSAYYFRADDYTRVTAAANALIGKGVAVCIGKYLDKKLVLKDVRGEGE